MLLQGLFLLGSCDSPEAPVVAAPDVPGALCTALERCGWVQELDWSPADCRASAEPRYSGPCADSDTLASCVADLEALACDTLRDEGLPASCAEGCAETPLLPGGERSFAEADMVQVGEPGAAFGNGLETIEEGLLVTAPDGDPGAVYLVAPSPGWHPAEALPTPILVTEGREKPQMTSYVGDLTGDGLTDLVVASPTTGQESFPQVGEVLVMDGLPAPGTTSAAAHARLWGSQEGSFFGTTFAVLGDTDGDGQDDLAVASSSGGFKLAMGMVHTFLGPLEGERDRTDADSEWYLSQTAWPEVMAIGDVDGDGLADVAIEDMVYQVVCVQHGPFPADFKYETCVDRWQSARARLRLLGLGDLDGDTAPDLLLSVPDWQTERGLGFVVDADVNGANDLEDLSPRLTAHRRAGLGVEGAVGDVDGDGRSDAFLVSDGVRMGGQETDPAIYAYAGWLLGSEIQPTTAFWPVGPDHLDAARIVVPEPGHVVVSYRGGVFGFE